MLRDLFFIARKDLKFMFLARETVVWVFIMPIIFFGFIGTVTGGFAPSGDTVQKLAVWAEADAGFLADQLIRRLEERDYTIVRPESEEEFAAYSRQLTLPAGFTTSLLANEPVNVQFSYKSEGLTGDYETIRVQRAVYTTLADLVVANEMQPAPTAVTIEELNAMPRAIQLEVKPAGERKRIPTGFEQAIPGIMVMFTMMIMTTSGAVLLLSEREEGLLRRLAYTPINRLSVVLGKWSGKLFVGMVQIAFAMLAGTLIFKMNWGADLPAIILLMLVYAGMMAALGVVLGSIARTEGQVIAIGVISTNVLAALGGCWWPIEITPDWMQRFQLFIPTGWAMDGLHKLISFAAGPASVIPHIVGMILATGVLVLVSVRVFRFQ